MQSCRLYRVELSPIPNSIQRQECAFALSVASSIVSSNSLLRKRFWVRLPGDGPTPPRNSTVEYVPFKHGVAGSNPVAGTFYGDLTQLGQEYSAFNRVAVGSQSTVATNFYSFLHRCIRTVLFSSNKSWSNSQWHLAHKIKMFSRAFTILTNVSSVNDGICLMWQTSACLLYPQFSQPVLISSLYSVLARPRTLAHLAEPGWFEISTSLSVKLSKADCSVSIHLRHFLVLSECNTEHFAQCLGCRFEYDDAHLEEHCLLQNTWPLLEYLKALGVLAISEPHIPHGAMCFFLDLSLLLYIAEHFRQQNDLLDLSTSFDCLAVLCPQFAQFTTCVFLPLDACTNLAQQPIVQNVFLSCLMFDSTSPFLFVICAPHPMHISGNKSLVLNSFRKSSVRCLYWGFIIWYYSIYNSIPTTTTKL